MQGGTLMQYKIMTFNIQHGLDHLRRQALPRPDYSGLSEEQRREVAAAYMVQIDRELIDLPKVAGGIRQIDPIFCGLNEVRNESNFPGFSDQAKTVAENAGMNYHAFGKAIDLFGQGPYGNGFVSSCPILSVETIGIPDPLVKDEDAYYETRCILKAKVQLPDGRPLTVMVTHIGLAKAEARNAVETILANTVPGEPTVLMGDFNLEPDSEILKPLWDGYTDTRPLLPAGTKTYPSHAPEIKIDYICVAGGVKALSAEVPELIISDHRPLSAVIEV